ncbi:PqiC family protein [Geomonas sp.]|uniref:PqiC family protein n=1 Tax=Geomonas sp. TaxID=2651584 RepID=UPI002B486E7E|nr:PqiC family protein [Geomonas sp.]HJV35585.1 PqiC family protein [Geomonas sp.]
MINGHRLTRAVIFLAVAIGLAGCASSPSARFYTLTPLSAQQAKQASPQAKPVSISIAPVELPDYLERPQIVTRDGQNEIDLAEYDRWAGSLSDNISAVLAENLVQLLNSDRVYVYPRLRTEKADYLVSMRILRLDCMPGNQVLLKAQWSVAAGADGKDVATRISTVSERLTDKGYPTMVAAVGRTLEQVSREIAREIPARQQ